MPAHPRRCRAAPRPDRLLHGRGGAEETVAALWRWAPPTPCPSPAPAVSTAASPKSSLGGCRRSATPSDQRPRRRQPRQPGPSRAASRHVGRAARLLAIGASTGGIHALDSFFEALPKRIGVPILVTQHLPASFMPRVRPPARHRRAARAWSPRRAWRCFPTASSSRRAMPTLTVEPRPDGSGRPARPQRAPAAACPRSTRCSQSVGAIYGAGGARRRADRHGPRRRRRRRRLVAARRRGPRPG